MPENKSYNKRLFNSGLRKYFHLSRFKWLKNQLLELEKHPSIIELGCFDLRSIEYLPYGFSVYEGYDANWENGLKEAKKQYAGNSNINLYESKDITTFNPSRQFDIGIALETLEHLRSDQLHKYLKRLHEYSNVQLYTIPNEQGFIFLLKHIYKVLTLKYHEKYSLIEFIHASLGNQLKVERRECTHKGFSWTYLYKYLNDNYHLVKIEGIPFKRLPICFNPTVGIIIQKHR